MGAVNLAGLHSPIMDSKAALPAGWLDAFAQAHLPYIPEMDARVRPGRAGCSSLPWCIRWWCWALPKRPALPRCSCAVLRSTAGHTTAGSGLPRTQPAPRPGARCCGGRARAAPLRPRRRGASASPGGCRAAGAARDRRAPPRRRCAASSASSPSASTSTWTCCGPLGTRCCGPAASTLTLP